MSILLSSLERKLHKAEKTDEQIWVGPSLDFICKRTPDGLIKYVTPTVYSMLGYEPSELVGKLYTLLVHAEDYKRILNADMPEAEDVCSLTYRIKRKDGVYIWVNSQISVVRHPETNEPFELFSVTSDVSAKIKTEHFILEYEKLNVVGQLAAGIAHEIKNPLTSLKGFIQLMKSGKELNHNYLAIMEEEIKRMETVSKELMIMAKPHKSDLKSFDVNDLVDHAITLLMAEAAKKCVEITKQSTLEDGMLLCDGNKIKQVLINMLMNAIDAMDLPGEITVAISRSVEELTIAIADSGSGIPSKDLDRIGKPFYTTKENGNGLGLMICYKIIEEHNGKINVVSNGEGTTFTIKLPIR
ncbi:MULTISPECIES: ATP-binding protein [unclassified Bacillus (in: firmicutes)]|uniref:ATP-binding protein n=1 Tax=unclassified Bacillus (in: firmicutes) TaxID=185979 RepID=UPI001BE8CED9|nr:MULTISPECIES: ATP-binding protein [unclassified Bacillus (in: firmicutes)]MBT2640325.1 PAS domain-containing protein [Bacillus sp. ISL-39]MBT2662735.1 PAS domain-containing protein [Bacillus sp. ISL-45]